jgi:hypothetical protein
MALYWDVTKVADHATITTHPEDLAPNSETTRWSPITESIVWMTVAVGINKITSENAELFFTRTIQVEHITGASLLSKDGPMFLTLGDIREHIGLTTNASTKTAAQFNAYLLRIIASEAKDRAARRDRLDPRSLREAMVERIKAAQ